MQKSFSKTACFVLVLMTLSACGTKGPLYIPERQYPQDAPQQAPTQPSNPNAN